MTTERAALLSRGRLKKGLHPAPFAVGTLVVALLPLLLSTYYQGVMTKFLIYAIFAMSLDLIYGYAGLLSLGHAAYFGMGGYVIAVLMYHFGVTSLWVGVPLGILIAAITAAIFGLIALRVKGIYFLLITFALGQLLYSVAWNVKWLSVPGVQGITGLSRPSLGFVSFQWTALRFYYLVLIGAVVVYAVLYKVTKSPLGLGLIGLREGPKRMRALGYNVWVYRYIAFVIAAAIAGFAGVLFAYHNQFIAPAQFGVETSFLVMCMVIIGGRGTLYGPIIGAAIIVFAEKYASSVTPDRWPLILGGIFVAAILFARDGVGVYLSELWSKVLRRGANDLSNVTVDVSAPKVGGKGVSKQH